jgi:ribonucleotide monophosphatase NagD (HAD superfamily)
VNPTSSDADSFAAANRGKNVTLSAILQHYPNLWIDAYGVLLHEGGVFPGAKTLIDHLNRIDHDYFIITNGASTDPKGHSQRYRLAGLEIPAERIVSSGYLLQSYLETSKATLATGPDSAMAFLKQLKVPLLPRDRWQEAQRVVIMEPPDEDFLSDAEAILNVISSALIAGRSLDLLLPNPDVIYPGKNGQYRYTAGGLALLIEAGLTLQFPGHAESKMVLDPLFGEQTQFFQRLGKPHGEIFREAKRRCRNPEGPTLMVGDQLQTDILGANRFGIDSALVAHGVLKALPATLPKSYHPRYYLPSLAL